MRIVHEHIVDARFWSFRALGTIGNHSHDVVFINVVFVVVTVGVVMLLFTRLSSLIDRAIISRGRPMNSLLPFGASVGIRRRPSAVRLIAPTRAPFFFAVFINF